VSYRGIIPPIASRFDLTYEMYGAAPAEPNFIYLVSSSDPPFWKSDANLASGYSSNIILPMPNQASGSFKFYLTATARTVRATAIGYTVPNGDN